jgi:hypothetical protein
VRSDHALLGIQLQGFVPNDQQHTLLLVDAHRASQEVEGTADVHLAQGEERIGIGYVWRTKGRTLRASRYAAPQESRARQQHTYDAESETCREHRSPIDRTRCQAAGADITNAKQVPPKEDVAWPATRTTSGSSTSRSEERPGIAGESVGHEVVRHPSRKEPSWPLCPSVVNRAGRHFSRLVLERLHESAITTSDVADNLNMNLKHLPKVENEVLRPAGGRCLTYSADTCGLIRLWNEYPPGNVVGLWEKLDGLITEGRLLAVRVREVLVELERKDDGICRW